MEYDYLFKIVIIGNSGVGKSCLNYRIANDTFGDLYPNNIGIEFHTKTLVIDGARVKLQIWDTAGQERFTTISSSYYRGAAGIILAYDITNVNSFNDVEIWIKAIFDKHNKPESVCKLLVGTKCDLADTKLCQSKALSYVERLPHQFQQHTSSSAHRLLQVGDSLEHNLREVDYPSAVEYAKKHNLIGAIETSALESINVELAFVTLATAMLHQKLGVKQERQQVEHDTTTTEQSDSWNCTTM